MLFSYKLSSSIHTKFQVDCSIFDTQMGCFFVSEIIPIYDVTFSHTIFCNFWVSYVKTNNTIRFLTKKLVKKGRHILSTSVILKI